MPYLALLLYVPIFLEILLETTSICLFQCKFEDKISPRNLETHQIFSSNKVINGGYGDRMDLQTSGYKNSPKLLRPRPKSLSILFQNHQCWGTYNPYNALVIKGCDGKVLGDQRG